MEECIFCRIIRGEAKGYFVYSDQHVVAFLDAYPLAEGHTLVVPRRHVRRLEDLTEEEACALSRAVLKVSRAISRALGASSLTIGVNDGPEAGQVVPHVHVHVIPRRAGDGAGNIHTIFRGARRPTGLELEDVARRIASGLEAD